MATAVQLRLPQGVPAVVDLDPVWLGNAVYDLTGVTLTAYVKSSAAIPDSDPSVAVITATPGPNGVIVVTDAVHGLATLTISGSVIPVPGTMFWHLDATDRTGAAGNIAYGPVYVELTSEGGEAPPLPAGGGGADAFFSQAFTSTASVMVTHNLGKYPSVSVTDSALDEVEGAVKYLSVNSLVVSFSAPFSGNVYCN